MNDTWKMITMIVAVVATTVGGLGWFSASVTKAINGHSTHPHPSTMQHLTDLQATDGNHGKELAKLESVPGELGAIRARIDLLLVSHHEEARRSPRKRARMRAEAERITSEALERGVDDPLAGMEGL